MKLLGFRLLFFEELKRQVCLLVLYYVEEWEHA